jgi:hypothetical protein
MTEMGRYVIASVSKPSLLGVERAECDVGLVEDPGGARPTFPAAGRMWSLTVGSTLGRKGMGPS